MQIVKGRPVLYVKSQQALYGTLRAPYVFLKRILDQLSLWDFMKNHLTHVLQRMSHDAP